MTTAPQDPRRCTVLAKHLHAIVEVIDNIEETIPAEREAVRGIELAWPGPWRANDSPESAICSEDDHDVSPSVADVEFGRWRQRQLDWRHELRRARRDRRSIERNRRAARRREPRRCRNLRRTFRRLARLQRRAAFSARRTDPASRDRTLGPRARLARAPAPDCSQCPRRKSAPVVGSTHAASTHASSPGFVP